MSNTTTPAPVTLAQLEAAREALNRAFYTGRSAMQAATRLDNIRRDNREAYANPARTAEDMAEAATLAPTLVERIEELAAMLPTLRTLAGVKPEPTYLGNLVVSVKYQGATNARSARLVATIAALNPNDKPDVRISCTFNHADPDHGGAQFLAQAALDRWNADLRKSAPACTSTATIRARGYHNGEHLFFCAA